MQIQNHYQKLFILTINSNWWFPIGNHIIENFSLKNEFFYCGNQERKVKYMYKLNSEDEVLSSVISKV